MCGAPVQSAAATDTVVSALPWLAWVQEHDRALVVIENQQAAIELAKATAKKQEVGGWLCAPSVLVPAPSQHTTCSSAGGCGPGTPLPPRCRCCCRHCC